MQGITAYVDLHAILINTKTAKHTNKWRVYESTSKGTKKWLIDWLAFKPAELDAKDLRRMQTILMGSIRPPHRLKYTKHTDSDICTHHECNGAKADTEHIFWDCSKWDHIRKPYMYQLKYTKQESAARESANRQLTTYYADRALDSAAFVLEMTD